MRRPPSVRSIARRGSGPRPARPRGAAPGARGAGKRRSPEQTLRPVRGSPSVRAISRSPNVRTFSHAAAPPVKRCGAPVARSDHRRVAVGPVLRRGGGGRQRARRSSTTSRAIRRPSMALSARPRASKCPWIMAKYATTVSGGEADQRPAGDAPEAPQHGVGVVQGDREHDVAGAVGVEEGRHHGQHGRPAQARDQLRLGGEHHGGHRAQPEVDQRRRARPGRRSRGAAGGPGRRGAGAVAGARVASIATPPRSGVGGAGLTDRPLPPTSNTESPKSTRQTANPIRLDGGVGRRSAPRRTAAQAVADAAPLRAPAPECAPLDRRHSGHPV